MKTKSRILVVVVVCFGVVGSVFAGTYGGGSGTEEDPYQIWTAEQMNAIGADPNDWDKCFVLMDDISLDEYTGEEFNIIAPDASTDSGPFEGTFFTGVFDGKGHIISNFTYTVERNYNTALFGGVGNGDTEEEGVIKNLTLEHVTVTVAGRSYTATVVGTLFCGTVSNCSVTDATVTGSSMVAGLVGLSYGVIVNCDVTGEILATTRTGGLVASNWGGRINNCHTSGTVTATSSTSLAVGGLAGSSNGDIINSRSNSDVVVGGGWETGGLVGRNDGSILNCCAGGRVTGENGVGGLVGFGYMVEGSIDNSYSTGTVMGIDWVGGLVGVVDKGTVSNCYSSGNVTGEDGTSGGLAGGVGYCDGGDCSIAHIEDCYWDIEASGYVNMCGVQDEGSTGCDNSYGKTTAQLHQQSTFTDWDFIHTWDIGENQTYPYLRTVPASDINKDRAVNLIDLSIMAGQWMEEE